MALKVLLELEAAEKLVIADMRIALLLAQAKVTEIKQRAEAEYAAANNDVQAKAQQFGEKLKSMAVAAKIDAADVQFDIEKYYFYVKTTVTEKVADAVKACCATITAEIKKGEAAVGEVKAAVVKEVAAVEGEVKAVFSETEQKVIDAVAEVKNAL